MVSTTNKWCRRDFLRNAVTASLLAPVMQLWPDVGFSATAEQVKRMVLVFLPNGTAKEGDFISKNGANWTFPPAFAPYRPFRDDLIAFRNYAFQPYIAAYYTGDHAGHIANAAMMFTGELPKVVGDRATAAMAPSIDQIVAWDYQKRGIISDPLRQSLHAKLPGSSFRLKSMFIRTPADYALNKTYARGLAPVDMHESPRAGFQQMFGDFTVMAGSTFERLWERGKSMLDVPNTELGRLRPTLPREGQRLVDEHMYQLRQLEKSFAAEPPETSAELPAAPGTIAFEPVNQTALMDAWVNVIEAAFRFDRTRIATLQFGGCASRFKIPELQLDGVVDKTGRTIGNDHHSYTHWAGDQVEIFFEWYAQRVASLLRSLKGDGTATRPNLLSHSVVMVGCEGGQTHRGIDIPVLLFGQAGGYLKTGQMLSYGNDLDNFYRHTGTLLTACRAMGVSGLNRVGPNKPKYQQGVVTEMLAQS